MAAGAFSLYFYKGNEAEADAALKKMKVLSARLSVPACMAFAEILNWTVGHEEEVVGEAKSLSLKLFAKVAERKAGCMFKKNVAFTLKLGAGRGDLLRVARGQLKALGFMADLPTGIVFIASVNCYFRHHSPA